MVNMNPDMVDEVKIQTSNYAAEYGNAHVQVTAVTKGGSPHFHGSRLRLRAQLALNANDRSNSYAGVTEPKSRTSTPASTSPVRSSSRARASTGTRDKLFFFVGYEYQHQVVDTGTSLGVVPTAAAA